MQFSTFAHCVVLRVEKGEELVASIQQCCEELSLLAASVSGIGATDDVTVGLFDPASKRYHSTRMQENFEIVSILGTISSQDAKPYLHLHIVVADSQHHCFGGHLNKAIISATAEVVIRPIQGELGRRRDPELGLNLLDV